MSVLYYLDVAFQSPSRSRCVAYIDTTNKTSTELAPKASGSSSQILCLIHFLFNCMGQAAISHCGHYVALAESAAVSIHRILPSFQLRHFDLDRDIRRHYNLSLLIGLNISITGIYWESVKSSEQSTKLAVSINAKDIYGVLIYDFSPNALNPVVIELESAIESVSWLLGVSKEGSAYKNCSQLVLFDHLRLEARVYSLDCTRMLFTIPKPVASSVIMRPHNDQFWSILLIPYFSKNLTSRSILVDLQADNHPYLLHFKNTGSRSTLLASLALDHQPSLSAEIKWDPTGNWISFFDSNDSIFGYSLRVYNTLALHGNSIDDLADHMAQATLYHTHDKKNGWLSLWLVLDGLLFIAATPTNSSKSLEIRIHSLSFLSIRYSVTVNVGKSENVWVQESSDEQASYRRTDVCPEDSFKWSNFKDSGDRSVLTSGNSVLILRRQHHDAIVKFEPEAFISSVRCLDVQFFNNSVALLFHDHVALYENETLSIKATSRYSLVELKITDALGSPAFTLTEQTPEGQTWMQKGQVSEETNDDSSMLIADKFLYKEDSKVVNLLKEVQKSEWGRAARRRLSEDTDTFHLNYKRKKPPGLPELQR